MLSKLFKYEIKATARLFLPIYLVLLVYSIVHKVISLLSPNKWVIPERVSLIIYIMILLSIFVMTIVIMIQRFYKNLLSDEGYLMFTLPAKPWKHIVSKLAISMIWMAISGIVAIISILIVAYNEFFLGELQNISDSIRKFFDYLGASSALFIVEILLLGIIGLASNVLIIYASIAVGHLFNRHRVLASFGGFIVMNAASQIIFTIACTIGSGILNSGGRFIQGEFLPTNPLFQYVMWFIIIFAGLLSAGYFILTNYILSRHLNLE